MEILIIDADANSGRKTAFVLGDAGYTTLAVSDAATALAVFARQEPSAVVLEVALPDMDGVQLSQRLRAISDVPLLILSSQTDVAERVRALTFGADDYLCKPIHEAELVARVQAVIRRARRNSRALLRQHVGPWLLEPLQATVVDASGQRITLTRTEFRLLAYLAANAGQVVSSKQVLDAVFGDSRGCGPNLVAVYVRRLRKRLKEDRRRPHHLRTVVGGYMLVAE